mmetsp:Transcript_25588/g.64993  ORF Transcript_25588/g.64993 Transcript_25588/m.64993 type:complete len:89 (+) Transcript_25588:1283-1549(+)
MSPRQQPQLDSNFARGSGAPLFVTSAPRRPTSLPLGTAPVRSEAAVAAAAAATSSGDMGGGAKAERVWARQARGKQRQSLPSCTYGHT